VFFFFLVCLIYIYIYTYIYINKSLQQVTFTLCFGTRDTHFRLLNCFFPTALPTSWAVYILIFLPSHQINKQIQCKSITTMVCLIPHILLVSHQTKSQIIMLNRPTSCSILIIVHRSTLAPVHHHP